jgi:hypothetical protein
MLIYGSKIRTAMIAVVLCLVMGPVDAQDDPSQRPLPLPEQGVTNLPQHMELLKRLRSLVESQQKNSEQPADDSKTSPRLPQLPSPADSNATPKKPTETAQEPSPFQPQQLQQFQDALKNLASQLPPRFVPPDLSSVPPDQLRRAMENPAVQQQMKQMLEQFAKDGVLPKPGDSGSQAPVPPQNDDRQNDGGQNDGSSRSLRKNESRGNKLNDRPSPEPSTQKEQNKPSEGAQRNPAPANGSPADTPPLPPISPLPPMQAGPAGRNPPDPNESASGDPAPSGSEASDSAGDAPPGSMRSLRSFLKKLAEDAGMKSPEPATDSSRSNGSAPSDLSQSEPSSTPATDEQTMRSEPKSSLGTNGVPSTRRPLRKRDSAKPKTSPPMDSSSSPAPDSTNSPAGQLPETSPEPLNRPNVPSGENIPENAPGSDASETSPAVPNPAFSNPPQGLRIDPESARKQLEELQKTIERMKEMAEESEQGRSSTEERPSLNGQSGRSDSNNNDSSSDSNSVPPSTGRNNRMANRPDADNRNGEQLPESLPNVDEFLREQLKNFKLPPDAVPGNNARNDVASKSSSPGTNPFNNPRGANPNERGVDSRIPIDSSPRDLSMDRALTPEELRRISERFRGRNSTAPANGPSAEESAKPEKPPIDIAKELEQRGFGNTLKQLVERAKEEAKKPRQAVPDPADAEKIAGNTDTTPADIEKMLKDATGAAKESEPELSKSMAKMLDGLKDDLVKIAKDAKFNDPPERPRSDRSMNSPSPTESNSMIDTLRKSASEILSGPPRSSSSGNAAGSSATAAASNAFSGEFDFTPVLVLAGVLAALAIAFFGLRHFKFRGEDAAEFQFAGPPLKPSDINSRADVVRAFHEFAMQSAQSVQSWWTHRTVQQAILEKAPENRTAVETLANTYEQARYLPVEQELSPEQLESARSALQQCSRKTGNG